MPYFFCWFSESKSLEKGEKLFHFGHSAQVTGHVSFWDFELLTIEEIAQEFGGG